MSPGQRKPTVAAAGWESGYLLAWDALPVCSGCDRKMRPAGATNDVWPATVSRATKRICQSCYSAGVRDTVVLSLVDNKTVRQQIASTWTPAEHATAWLVCGRFGAETSAELMEILGLFDPSAYSTGLNSLQDALHT